MISKQTWLSISDGTNVSWLQTFHLYKGFDRRQTGVGFFVKGSAKIIQPPRIEYKGFKYKSNKRGDICRGLVVRQRYPITRYDGTTVWFKTNNAILIKKKQNLKSSYILGPSTIALRRKKFKSVFPSLF